jgi:orotidine-5'-phosphate decarboxylase
MLINEKIANAQTLTNTMLCVGLDTELAKLPKGIMRNHQGIVEFNKHIISATKDLCSSYKINFAFYEQYGSHGFDIIEQTLADIPSTHVTIADAKRGDIGNTSTAYANAILIEMGFDCITVSPYMGSDSIEPFLDYDNKLVFVLALTSNPGSADFQHLMIDDIPLYQHVITRSQTWKRKGELGYVVGATHPEQLSHIRSIVPNAPLLIPGVGAQGGDPNVIREMNNGGVAFVNASRAIIYASSCDDFAVSARTKAEELSLLLSINPISI